MSRIWKNARRIVADVFGRRRRRSNRESHRSLYAPTSDDLPTLAAGLDIVRRRWPDVRSTSDDRPIFLLAAGWRSGSTYLQRRIIAAGNVLIWGEPYGHAAVIDRVAHAIRCITPSWPHDDWFLADGAAQRLSTAWIANLYPPVATLLASHLAFFDAAFGAPARAVGVERWGIKEVRLTTDHAVYLRWLYPRSKIVFLYRDPYAAYRSYRRWRSWYLTWPHDAVTTPERFGRHWQELVAGFVSHHGDVDGLLLRYEDLDAAPTLAALSRHLELAIPTGPLERLRSRQRRDAGAGADDPPAARIPDEELEALERVVGPLAASLGYTPKP